MVDLSCQRTYIQVRRELLCDISSANTSLAAMCQMQLVNCMVNNYRSYLLQADIISISDYISSPDDANDLLIISIIRTMEQGFSYDTHKFYRAISFFLPFAVIKTERDY